jgi:hypothetical protein
MTGRCSRKEFDTHDLATSLCSSILPKHTRRKWCKTRNNIQTNYTKESEVQVVQKVVFLCLKSDNVFHNTDVITSSLWGSFQRDGRKLPKTEPERHMDIQDNQYNETSVMHFSFNFLRIKGLYMFRALLAHPQKALHKWHLVYCLRIRSAGFGTVACCNRATTDIIRTQYTKFSLCSASWGWGNNARNM